MEWTSKGCGPKGIDKEGAPALSATFLFHRLGTSGGIGLACMGLLQRLRPPTILLRSASTASLPLPPPHANPQVRIHCLPPPPPPLMPILRSASTAAFLPGWDLWRDAGIDFTPLYTEIYEPESPANRQEVLDLLDKVLFLREGGFGSECGGRQESGQGERGGEEGWTSWTKWCS